MSAHELIDFLDASGHVIGVTTRADVRARKLPHRCVYILVFNRLGKLFIHQRTATKDVFPSYWDVSIGGVVAAGESFDQAALREGGEELGVSLAPEPLFPFSFTDERTTAFAHVYRAIHDGPFQLQAEEIVQGQFINANDVALFAAKQPFCPDGLEVWKQYQKERMKDEG